MTSKKIKVVALLLLSITLTVSCSKNSEEEFSLQKATYSLTLDNGNEYLAFKSANDLKNTIDYMKDNRSSCNLNTMYNNGFIPLKVSDNVDEFTVTKVRSIRESVAKFSNAKLMTRTSSSEESDIPDEDETIVSNDEFASILNYKGEVLVGDTIYRYTNAGVFFAHKDHHLQLSSYLENYSSTDYPNLSGVIRINSYISRYIPERAPFGKYALSMPGDIIIDDDGGYAGGGNGGTPMPNIEIPSNTDNYNVCVNEKASWIDNIFGKTYSCDYKFSDDRKLRTTFAVEDYYIFFDVYAKAKFKKKTWLGWFSCREANRVYLKINRVGLEFSDRVLKLKINVPSNDITSAFNRLSNIFSNSTNKKAAFISNIYTRSGEDVLVTEYRPTYDEIGRYANGADNYINTPISTENRTDIKFDYSEYFGNRVNKVIVITFMGKPYEISQTNILQFLKSNIERFVNGQKSVGVLAVNPQLDGSKSEIMSYIITDELHDVRNLASVSRSFDVPKGIKIKSLSLSMKKELPSDPAFSINVEFAWKQVKDYDVNIETGAYFNGIWGGSKFIVTKN